MGMHIHKTRKHYSVSNRLRNNRAVCCCQLLKITNGFNDFPF